MREKDLRLLLGRDPRPLLRLHLTGGHTFDLTDDELPVLSRSTVEIPLPPQDRQQREAVINLLHIVWVEVINPPN
jgi:hypothetical protein